MYLQIISNALYSTNSKAMITVFSESNHRIVTGKTNAYNLNIDSYGAYYIGLEDYMEEIK